MKIFKFILATSVLVFILCVTYSYLLPKTYGSNLNSKRKNLNLIEINKSWKLDSIWSDKNGFSDAKKINKIKYFFNFNTEIYYQSWSKLNDDKTLQQEKELVFSKSFWFWKNKLISEGHSYYLPISKYQYQDLYTYYEFDTKKRDCSIDTLDTVLKSKQGATKNDSLKKLDFWICGTGLVDKIDDFNVDSIACDKIISIIKRRALKN